MDILQRAQLGAAIEAYALEQLAKCEPDLPPGEPDPRPNIYREMDIRGQLLALGWLAFWTGDMLLGTLVQRTLESMASDAEAEVN